MRGRRGSFAVVPTILRRLVGRSSSSSIDDAMFVSSIAAATTASSYYYSGNPTFLTSSPTTITAASPPALLNHFRTFSSSSSSSSSSSDSSKVVVIESEKQFDDSLRKVQDESLPAVFYFTAVWCGPCRLLSPIIGQLSEKYPHVTTYKIDIDQEGLRNALSKLDIHAVPTLHFFQNGTKAGEVVGADVQQLKDTMEALYK